MMMIVNNSFSKKLVCKLLIKVPINNSLLLSRYSLINQYEITILQINVMMLFKIKKMYSRIFGLAFRSNGNLPINSHLNFVLKETTRNFILFITPIYILN